MLRTHPTTRRLPILFAIAMCLALVAPAAARADVIGQWNLIAQTETLPLRPTAHGESRGIAMVEGAVYDAVNAIDRGYWLLAVPARRRRCRRPAFRLAGCRRRDGCVLRDCWA